MVLMYSAFLNQLAKQLTFMIHMIELMDVTFSVYIGGVMFNYG